MDHIYYVKVSATVYRVLTPCAEFYAIETGDTLALYDTTGEELRTELEDMQAVCLAVFVHLSGVAS